MDKQKTSSMIPNKIIKILSGNKTRNFSMLKNELRTSSPTLSLHLKELLSKGIIDYDKIGKEKKYRLNSKVLDTFETKLNIISENYTSWYDGEFDQYENSIVDLTKYITESISGIFLHSILNSLKTGNNHTKIIDLEEMIEITIRPIIELSRENHGGDFNKIDTILSHHDFDVFFKIIRDKLSPEIKNKIKLISDELEKTNTNSVYFLKNESNIRNDW